MVLRTLSIAAGLSLAIAATADAQSPKPKYPVVCGKGVRVYTDRAQLPAKRDSLVMPPSGGPIRVTSPEEAEAADLAVRERAGSVGATSILVVTESTEENGGERIRRMVTPFFIPSDSAQAQEACKKK